MGSTADWRRIRDGIEEQARTVGFEMSSMTDTGGFLAALAASKRGGRMLELGTGLGCGASHLLEGMSMDSRLVTVDNDEELSRLAQENLGFDSRVEFIVEDGGDYLLRESRRGTLFDLVFADAWPGKFSALEEALQLIAPGGFYVVDDLLPQPAWPKGHDHKVRALLMTLPADERFSWIHLGWASGLLVGVRR